MSTGARQLFQASGTPEAGYETWVELEDLKYLRMHVRGVWPEDMALAYERALDERYPAFRGQPYSAIVDARDSPVQSVQVREIRSRCIRKALQAGMERVAYITSGTLPLLQLRRMAQASGCKEAECFESEGAARHWVEQRVGQRRAVRP